MAGEMTIVELKAAIVDALKTYEFDVVGRVVADLEKTGGILDALSHIAESGVLMPSATTYNVITNYNVFGFAAGILCGVFAATTAFAVYRFWRQRRNAQ